MEGGTLLLPSVKVSVHSCFPKKNACVDFGGKAGCIICNFSNFVAYFGNGCKMNYIPGNFELLKEELTRVSLFKLQSMAKALLDTLQSPFIVSVYYM